MVAKQIRKNARKVLNASKYHIQNLAMVNRIWPTAVAGEADSVSSVSASDCHIGGPNSVNPGQILLA